MSTISTFGKYLDQPMLVSKISEAAPATLVLAAAAYGLYDTKKQKDEEKQVKTYIKNICVLGFTVAFALIATKKMSSIKSVEEIKQVQTKIIDAFLKSNKTDKKTAEILQKAKEKVLKHSEIKHLYAELSKNESGQNFLKKDFVPAPKNISSKDIFGEIGRLSLLGLVPIAGGITGGIIGDKLTENDWKSRIPDKIKEGSYQYLANIFLCNVGAGATLALMEKFNVKSKAARAGAMIAGIILTGVIGGSAIANYIGKKCINPLFGKISNKSEAICTERTPEALDVCLHADDAATVAVMSGLRWIEPALPILYSISGYRAGIGYRNGGWHHKRRNNMENNPKFFCYEC